MTTVRCIGGVLHGERMLVEFRKYVQPISCAHYQFAEDVYKMRVRHGRVWLGWSGRVVPTTLTRRERREWLDWQRQHGQGRR